MRFSFHPTTIYRTILLVALMVVFFFAAHSTAFAQGQIINLSVTEETHNSARINFNLFPSGGIDVDINIYYGTSKSSLTQKASVFKGSIAAQGIPITKNLTALDSDTLYYFTVKNDAISPAQIFVDPPHQFVTLAPPPIIKTFSATNVTTTSATLNGFWSDNGFKKDGVDTAFEYGTIKSGSQIFNENNTPSSTTNLISRGNGSGNISETITNLNPNKTYFFKLLGNNTGGDREGIVLSLLTDALADTTTVCKILSATFTPSDDTNPPPKTSFMDEDNQPEVLLTIETRNCEDELIFIRLWEIDNETDETDDSDDDIAKTIGNIKVPLNNKLEIKLRAGDFQGDLSVDPDASYYAKITGSGIEEFSSKRKADGTISYDCDGLCGTGWKVIGGLKWWFKKIDFNSQITSEGGFDTRDECSAAIENIVTSGAYGITIAAVSECVQVNSPDEIPDAALTGQCSVVSAEFSPSHVNEDTFFDDANHPKVNLEIETINCVGQELSVSIWEDDTFIAAGDNIVDDTIGDDGIIKIIPEDKGSFLEKTIISLLAGEDECDRAGSPECQYYIKVTGPAPIATYISQGKPNGELNYNCDPSSADVSLLGGGCWQDWSLEKIESPEIGPLPGDITFDLSGPYTLLAPLPGTDGTIDTSADKLGKYFELIFKLLIGIAGVLAVVMIVMGGIQYMMEESILAKGEAKKRITSAIGGLLLALGAFAILFTINPDLVNLNLGIRKAFINIDPKNEPGFGVTRGTSLAVINKDGSSVLLNSNTSNNCADIRGDLQTITLFEKQVTVHKGVVKSLTAIDQRWKNLGGNNYYKVNTIGSFSCRIIRGTDKMSIHAFGLALDINQKTNPFKTKLKTDMDGQNPPFWQLFANTTEGWGWGGNWTGKKDPMHFSKFGAEGGNLIVDF
ncbi:hypothetical protein COB64_02015 [Candidatus Wolfebacteria bacterium]|nr:MAG: hypothetical protein COB64_02015 [Candidatus Wolfebacteria bacterium]